VKTPSYSENSRIYLNKRTSTSVEEAPKIEGPDHSISSQAANPNMSEVTVPTLSPLQEKISKLKSLLSEEDLPGHNNSDNQWRREAKLKQKLRYLQFYEDYSVGTPSTADWHCSHCKSVLVDIPAVTYPGCSMKGQCEHRVSHKKEITRKVSEIVCEDREEHQREWEQWQKSQVEVRNTIRRDFSAMIAKEKQKKTNKRTNTKENIITQDDDVKIQTKPTHRVSVKQPAKDKQDLSKEKIANESDGKQNFHSDQCKTCIKMKNLMGSILPHPINI